MKRLRRDEVICNVGSMLEPLSPGDLAWLELGAAMYEVHAATTDYDDGSPGDGLDLYCDAAERASEDAWDRFALITR